MRINQIDNKKLEFIENYFFEHCEDDYFYIVLHSLFNCLTESEIQMLYFQYAKGIPALKKTIESYIVKRSTNEPKRQFNKVAITLLKEYADQDYQTQITTRTFLAQFIRTLPLSTVQTYFDTLILSERKFDRHRANEVADLILTDEIKGQLIDIFYKYKDEYSLLPLVDNLSSEELYVIIEKVWTKDFPSPRLKNSILKKISNLEIDYFSFLKEMDISYYLQILNLKQIDISDIEISKLVKTANQENKYYLLWTIGMTGKWNQTIKYIEKLNIWANG
ncbi:hypothetical protein ACWA1C_02595 [Flectobacillus roseus]